MIFSNMILPSIDKKPGYTVSLKRLGLKMVSRNGLERVIQPYFDFGV